MPFPKIAAVAHCDAALHPSVSRRAQSAGARGYADEEAKRILSPTATRRPHLWIDPAASADESVDERSTIASAPAPCHLGESAARARWSGPALEARDVDFHPTTTCTGRLTPSLDAHPGVRPDSAALRNPERVHVGDTGCARGRCWSRSAGGEKLSDRDSGRRASSSPSRSDRRLLPGRPARERGGARDLRGRATARSPVTNDGPGPSIVAPERFSFEHLAAMDSSIRARRLRVTLSRRCGGSAATMMREDGDDPVEAQGLKREEIRTGCCTPRAVA